MAKWHGEAKQFNWSNEATVFDTIWTLSEHLLVRKGHLGGIRISILKRARFFQPDIKMNLQRLIKESMPDLWYLQLLNWLSENTLTYFKLAFENLSNKFLTSSGLKKSTRTFFQKVPTLLSQNFCQKVTVQINQRNLVGWLMTMLNYLQRSLSAHANANNNGHWSVHANNNANLPFQC